MLIFDIDGVVADIHSFCLKDIAEKAGCRVDEVTSGTHDIKVPDDVLTRDEIFNIAVSTTVKYVKDILPYEGAIAFLQSYYNAIKEPIRFLTARTSSRADIVECTYLWLRWHLGVPFYVHFASDKQHFLKCNPQFTGIVEDRLSTANSLDFLDRVFLVNREWNIGRIPNPRLIRINTLQDIWQYIG